MKAVRGLRSAVQESGSEDRFPMNPKIDLRTSQAMRARVGGGSRMSSIRLFSPAELKLFDPDRLAGQQNSYPRICLETVPDETGDREIIPFPAHAYLRIVASEGRTSFPRAR